MSLTPENLSVFPISAGTPRAGSFPMGRLEMNGPYPLTAAAIDARLPRISPGNYALGYLDGDTFLVFFVGRSDFDVKRGLHDWVGAPTRARVGGRADDGYTHFAYSYAPSAEAAFGKEWRNYDDFGGYDGLDNADPPSQAAHEQGPLTRSH
jgi:hypothetical protein